MLTGSNAMGEPTAYATRKANRKERTLWHA